MPCGIAAMQFEPASHYNNDKRKQRGKSAPIRTKDAFNTDGSVWRMINKQEQFFWRNINNSQPLLPGESNREFKEIEKIKSYSQPEIRPVSEYLPPNLKLCSARKISDNGVSMLQKLKKLYIVSTGPQDHAVNIDPILEEYDKLDKILEKTTELLLENGRLTETCKLRVLEVQLRDEELKLAHHKMAILKEKKAKLKQEKLEYEFKSNKQKRELTEKDNKLWQQGVELEQQKKGLATARENLKKQTETFYQFGFGAGRHQGIKHGLVIGVATTFGLIKLYNWFYPSNK